MISKHRQWERIGKDVHTARKSGEEIIVSYDPDRGTLRIESAAGISLDWLPDVWKKMVDEDNERYELPTISRK